MPEAPPPPVREPVAVPAPAAEESSRPSGTAHRTGLGAGLVEVPPVPARDPESAIIANPVIPEARRFCGGCEAPVGRGRPGRTEGYCSKCRTRFSFTPALRPGDLVAGQYEVLGCLARGGLGWIHLAKDRNVSDRWVVLKGLLDAGDADAKAAARAERRFLAEVEHPDVVKIYNFVRHEGAGYIVMEYLGGRSLRDLVVERRKETGTSPPLPEVIAYGLEVLRALDHLHGNGLLYCDFKPANAILTGDRLRLIDLGGVRRAGDLDGPIYGTTGFQAPEIADAGPSVTADLYTVARAMAVLSFEFTGFTGRFRHTLPDRERVPLLARHESYDLLLRRATAPDPAARFESAAEMAEQLTGVLREVLAADDGTPRPAPSVHFGPELRVAGIGGTGPPPAPTIADALPVPLNSATGDWRTEWFRGIVALTDGRPGPAAAHFGQVRALLPGEAAPQLALGFCAELRGDPAAEGCYERVWETGRAHLSAAFGLARARVARRDRAGAVHVLSTVPPGSVHHADAQIAAILARLRRCEPQKVSVADLLEAGRRLQNLELPVPLRERLTVLVLETALDRLRIRSIAAPPETRLLGRELTERDLSAGLESAFRTLAKAAGSARERAGLVERANSLRPKTLL